MYTNLHVLQFVSRRIKEVSEFLSVTLTVRDEIAYLD